MTNYPIFTYTRTSAHSFEYFSISNSRTQFLYQNTTPVRFELMHCTLPRYLKKFSILIWILHTNWCSRQRKVDLLCHSHMKNVCIFLYMVYDADIELESVLPIFSYEFFSSIKGVWQKRMLVSNNRHSLSALVEHVGISLQVNTIIDNYCSAWGEDRLLHQ